MGSSSMSPKKPRIIRPEEEDRRTRPEEDGRNGDPEAKKSGVENLPDGEDAAADEAGKARDD
jgi:hypothetical protein